MRLILIYLLTGILFAAYFFNEWHSRCPDTNFSINEDVMLTSVLLVVVWPAVAMIYLTESGRGKFPGCPEFNVGADVGVVSGKK